MKNLRFAVMIFFAVLATSFLFLLLAAGDIYDYRDDFDADVLKNADVILCLAGGRGRIAYAARVWSDARESRLSAKIKAPIFYLAGVGIGTEFKNLKEFGIPESILEELHQDTVIIEGVSQNTYENAQLFRSFARQQGWKKVLVVTSSYHMKRARFILQKTLDPDVQIFSKSSLVESYDDQHWRTSFRGIVVTFVEYIKWLYYRRVY